ncbi:MAG: hypothetical protein ACC669_08860 [bacterium]
MKQVNWFPKKKRRSKKTHLFIGLLLGFLLSMTVQDKVLKIVIIYGVAIVVFVAGEYMNKRKRSGTDIAG